jgi:hypothetical protein
MSTCASCHGKYHRRDNDVSLTPNQRLCDDCIATGKTPAAESRQAMMVTRQVWTFTESRGLEQRTLPRRATAVRLDRVRLPRWYVGPKDKTLPRAAIYCVDCPDASLLKRVAGEASERFKEESWMA